jgi:hypothetical protein
VTGITPQPYVTRAETDLISLLCFSGTWTKKKGEGPFQKIILPENFISMKLVYQMYLATRPDMSPRKSYD